MARSPATSNVLVRALRALRSSEVYYAPAPAHNSLLIERPGREPPPLNQHSAADLEPDNAITKARH